MRLLVLVVAIAGSLGAACTQPHTAEAYGNVVRVECVDTHSQEVLCWGGVSRYLEE